MIDFGLPSKNAFASVISKYPSFSGSSLAGLPSPTTMRVPSQRGVFSSRGGVLLGGFGGGVVWQLPGAWQEARPFKPVPKSSGGQ